MEHLNRRHFTACALAAAAAAAGLLATTPASAQAFPDKPLRLVVGAPAGGTADMVARVLAEGLGQQLGQPVLVNNKPGAAGLLGIQELLKAPRDGYTLMLAVNGIVSEVPHIVRLPIDPVRELRPLAEIGRGGLVFVTPSQLPVQSLKDAIAYAKANAGKVNYGSYAVGSISHTLGLELNKLAGLDMVHVGYRGSPAALVDMVGGQLQFMFDAPATSLPLIRAGKIRALATTAPQRVSVLPDVPTFAELGYKDLTELAWLGLWTTPDVPAPVQARVREAAIRVTGQAAVKERLQGLGIDPGTTVTPDAMITSLKAAYDKQGATLKAIDFKPD